MEAILPDSLRRGASLARMHEDKPRQERRSPRAKLLMAAILEHRGGTMAVKLRDLSVDGALVEGDHCPRAGSRVVFYKNELALSGRIAWSKGGRAGIAFDAGLDPEAVLRHIPSPRPLRIEVHKRPGLRGQLSAEDRLAAERLYGRPLPSAGK